MQSRKRAHILLLLNVMWGAGVSFLKLLTLWFPCYDGLWPAAVTLNEPWAALPYVGFCQGVISAVTKLGLGVSMSPPAQWRFWITSHAEGFNILFIPKAEHTAMLLFCFSWEKTLQIFHDSVLLYLLSKLENSCLTPSFLQWWPKIVSPTSVSLNLTSLKHLFIRCVLSYFWHFQKNPH